MNKLNQFVNHVMKMIKNNIMIIYNFQLENVIHFGKFESSLNIFAVT